MVTTICGLLCLFTILFVNFNVLQPQSALALFTMLGMTLCYLTVPGLKRANRLLGSTDDRPSDGPSDSPSASTSQQGQSPLDSAGTPLAKQSVKITWWNRIDQGLGWLGAVLSIVCFGYIFIQTEPIFSGLWPESEIYVKPMSLGERAGDENRWDVLIGVIGLVLVLEATRRTIGWIVPMLAILFLLHAFYASQMPDWLLPHQGQKYEQIVSSTFLQSLGVLGPATSVMFRFVFLFVVFGAFLEMSGATQFIINLSQRVFYRSVGGAAKISVLSSGLMGSLSGSAVANAVTTGTFTIPMMKSSGFRSHEAAAVEAAAGTGGSMVPPVMGAAAYMMLELVENVTFLQIIKAALIPAILYYFSLFLIVHFQAKRRISAGEQTTLPQVAQVNFYEGVVFFGALSFLVGLLLLGFSPFRAVTGAMVLILVLALFRQQLPLGWVPRLMALAAFVIVVVGHQSIGLFQDQAWTQHPLIRPFMATGWIHPDGFWSWRLTFESLLNSCIIGSVGLILFGLCQSAWRPEMAKALKNAATNGVPLITASACVGIIIGIVQVTPMASDFSGAIKGLVDTNLLLALIGIMGCSLVLGMGVPPVVCYLLVATLMGSVLSELGVAPLAAHFFILYYGMMSMVTPPVALAAYAAASISDAPIMRTAITAFQYSLVGFALPFMFVYQPELLLISSDGGAMNWVQVAYAVISAVLGIIALAAAITGFFRGKLSILWRLVLLPAAVLLLWPSHLQIGWGLLLNAVGLVILGATAIKPTNSKQH